MCKKISVINCCTCFQKRVAFQQMTLENAEETNVEGESKTKHRSQIRSTKQGFVKKNVRGFDVSEEETVFPSLETKRPRLRM